MTHSTSSRSVGLRPLLSEGFERVVRLADPIELAGKLPIIDLSRTLELFN
jgi:hypothetical protein